MEKKDRKAAIASTFQGISEMLDSAAVGQGYLFSTILQWFTVVLRGNHDRVRRCIALVSTSH